MFRGVKDLVSVLRGLGDRDVRALLGCFGSLGCGASGCSVL